MSIYSGNSSKWFCILIEVQSKMHFEYFLVIASFFIIQIKGSALHGHCFANEDCGTIDTYCKNQTCVCKEDFAVWYDSCVHLASPRLRCAKRHDCQNVLGVKSMCTKNSLCACKPFHHLHHGQCVKNRDLNDICEHDHQCYCGADCEDKIACIGKNCSCRPGHKPYRSRRCIYDPENPPSSKCSSIYYTNSVTLALLSTTLMLKIL